jgi:hypothetical protein
LFIPFLHGDDLNRMDHFLAQSRVNTLSICLNVSPHQIPIPDERVIESYDIHVPEVTDVVTTSEIRRLPPLAASDSKLYSGH